MQNICEATLNATDHIPRPHDKLIHSKFDYCWFLMLLMFIVIVSRYVSYFVFYRKNICKMPIFLYHLTFSTVSRKKHFSLYTLILSIYTVI